ncbi:MAG: Rrf2 family transcriptional regulator [Patescibacteria group bacterium]|nr:Rrf2 family transcriptional regulator [Patescibacteria group bacterium]
MKFSTRTTYGLRGMIQLAKNWEQGSMSLASIAKQEKISQGYLERLFAKLKKANLVIAEKGSTGGYALAISPSKINIFDIVKTLEGKMTPFYCLSENGKIYCDAKCGCGATKVLAKVQQAVNSTLRSMTLNDLF